MSERFRFEVPRAKQSPEEIKERREFQPEFIEAKKLYNKLKGTVLWDKEEEQWNSSIDEEGKLDNPLRFSDTQLIGVLAEAFNEDPEKFLHSVSS